MESVTDALWDSPLGALLLMRLKNVRVAQQESGRAFAAGPFDAMLVGACGVQAWSAPLVRMLGSDARTVVESFLRPRITSRAAAVLQTAVERFLIGVFSVALHVAADSRNAACVWACDIEDAIKICGVDRVAGTCRPQTGCACAGLVSASTADSEEVSTMMRDSEEAQTAPAVAWRRRTMTWCEAAPLDGSSPQSAIHRSMRWIACRAGVPHLAPGVLNVACSAVCAFISTVLAKARGAEHPLLREAAESDSRVERLVELVHTSCAASLSSDESGSESYAWERPDPDSDDSSNMRYAWEHTLRTRYLDLPGYDGLTERVVLRALEDLDYTVSSDAEPSHELAARFHTRFGRNVLGLLRDGVLNVERFLSELIDDEDVDDRFFGLQMTKYVSKALTEEDIASEPRCGVVGSRCPRCDRDCLLWLVKVVRNRLISVEPVVDMEAVLVAQTRAGERWAGCEYFDTVPHVAPPRLWTVLPARRRALRQGMDGGALAARAHRMLMEVAARRAGFTHWAPEVEGLVSDLVKEWGSEIAMLARSFLLHQTAHREAQTIHAEFPCDILVAAHSGPLTFSSVARAVVTLLERSKRRGGVLYVRPFDSAAFPYAEPLLGPHEMGTVIELGDEFCEFNAKTATFDAEANALISRVFAHRLAGLFHRARRVCPQFDLPGGGHGPVLVPRSLRFVDSCSLHWATVT